MTDAERVELAALVAKPTHDEIEAKRMIALQALEAEKPVKPVEPVPAQRNPSVEPIHPDTKE